MEGVLEGILEESQRTAALPPCCVLQGKPYAYTPFCTSREETLGFQFWRQGYWKNHLQGRPYHISALYVVDLVSGWASNGHFCLLTGLLTPSMELLWEPLSLLLILTLTGRL